jgi:hypothetical protein
MSFDKTPIIEGRLLGIKGQYLIFEGGKVLNMRKHQAYVLKFTTEIIQTTHQSNMRLNL